MFDALRGLGLGGASSRQEILAARQAGYSELRLDNSLFVKVTAAKGRFTQMVEIDPFSQALTAYKAAVYAKDVDAFAALYDPQVHVFDMWGTWSIQGLAPWRAMAETWFSSLGDESVIVTTDNEISSMVENLAIGHAVLTYTATTVDGAILRSLSNRATMALHKAETTWKIFHEHTSAPIDHRSKLAILGRSNG